MVSLARLPAACPPAPRVELRTSPRPQRPGRTCRKLTYDQVCVMRIMHLHGGVSQAHIARSFGISQYAASLLFRGYSYHAPANRDRCRHDTQEAAHACVAANMAAYMAEDPDRQAALVQIAACAVRAWIWPERP